jgi:hypothetical protein
MKKKKRQNNFLLPVIITLVSIGMIFFVSQKNKTLEQSLASSASITYTYTPVQSSYVWNEEFGLRTTGLKWIGTGKDTKGSYTVITVVGNPIPKGSLVSSAKLMLTSLQQQSSPAYTVFHAEYSPGTHGGLTAGKWPSTAANVIFKTINTSYAQNQQITIDLTSVLSELIATEGTGGTVNFVAHGGTTSNEKFYIYGGDATIAGYKPTLTVTFTQPTPVTTPRPTNIIVPTPTAAPAGAFVKRSGADLYLNGQKMRFVGANIYWLGMAEAGGVAQPTQFEVDDALATAKEMGANVVRSFGTISVGCSICIEPSLNTFNENGFKSLDYAIFSGKKLGLRFIFTLTDNYQYYTGGKFTFTNWRGVSNEQFFTNPIVISDYKNYIQKILNHVNPYTGLAYKNDPTIAAWETGNELYVGTSYSKTSFSSWTDTISSYIKSLAPSQLVVDGRYGLDDASLKLANVDIYSNHYRNVSDILGEAAYVRNNGKAYMLGEYDWTGKRLTVTLVDYLNTIKDADVDIVSFWSLFGHNDTYGFIQHGDGYTLHYPGYNNEMISRSGQIRSAYYGIRNLSVPNHGIPGIPLLNTLNKLGSAVSVTFRGSVASASYQLLRSIDGGSTWTMVVTNLKENSLPYIDNSTWTGTALYKVRGINLSGVYGEFSNTESIKK